MSINNHLTIKMSIFVTIAQQNTMSIVQFSQRQKNSKYGIEKFKKWYYTTLVLEKSTEANARSVVIMQSASYPNRQVAVTN